MKNLLAALVLAATMAASTAASATASPGGLERIGSLLRPDDGSIPYVNSEKAK